MACCRIHQAITWTNVDWLKIICIHPFIEICFRLFKFVSLTIYHIKSKSKIFTLSHSGCRWYARRKTKFSSISVTRAPSAWRRRVYWSLCPTPEQLKQENWLHRSYQLKEQIEHLTTCVLRTYQPYCKIIWLESMTPEGNTKLASGWPNKVGINMTKAA